MTLAETLELLAQIALVDDRVVKVDTAEQRAQVTMWASTLRDVPLDFAGEAVGRHYAESAWPIMPKDIAARWRDQVRDRLGRSTGTFEPTDHPHLDPDDVDGYVAALRSHRRAIAGGDSEPVGLRELMPAVGDRLGGGRLAELVPANDTFREVREQHYPRRARPAGPPELAVHCPVCGVSAGRPCKTTSRGRQMRGTHPSRRDVWEAQQTTEGADA
ncbi:hypothetical protein SUDANB1_05277 [Streptomyces sp. enrichment culture]|uniref:zinc finger domain-containing protein n=1 Tax=Streptomyces sp. enrichment culture TaxID=1795815 RepID=UPI003F54D6DA